MNKSTKSLVFAAAVSGLLGGTTARLQAQPSGSTNSKVTVSQSSKAGVRLVAQLSDQDTGKHSCKGKNDCKGQGGCKSSDNGCKGKNSCKGKGGCGVPLMDGAWKAIRGRMEGKWKAAKKEFKDAPPKKEKEKA